MKFRRLLSLLLAALMLLATACAAREDSPIEELAGELLFAQTAFTSARETMLDADEALAALEKKYDKNPNDPKLQDRIIDAMILQEEAAGAFIQANAALLALQEEQTRMIEKAECEELLAEYEGKYADILLTAQVDENMVLYGLTVQVEGSERDQLVARNDYLYTFLGKDLPLTIGEDEEDDVAPLKDAQQTSRDLVSALNSLVYMPDREPEPARRPAGPIIEPQDIADYLFAHGELPDNFITKKEAQKLGWDSRENYVSDVAPGKSIGGDRFGNYEGLLPSKKGRTWYEADCYYTTGKRNAHRILYSSDGLVYYTKDHYESFTEMKPSGQ